MKTIGIVLQDHFQLMGLAAVTPFDFANFVLQIQAYRCRILSEYGGPVCSSSGVSVVTEPLGTVPDTLMVVGQSRPRPASPSLCAYIAGAVNQARRVAGICTGAFALAEAGVLDGRVATTHWGHAATLRKKFPAIKVDDDRIFVADGPVWTSAGMTAAIDLALALIEEDHGSDTARCVARHLVVYHRRPGGQSQFSALLELEPRSDRIQRALIYAKEHLANPLSVEELAHVASLSPRQFSRAFRQETGHSPAKAVERLRLEAAQILIENGRHSLETVASESGFQDRDRMRRAFIRAYGHSPRRFRQIPHRSYDDASQ
ncbi:GlxA family transcriptional regulator [Novosphingobium sp. ZN18A2]|uniref:GlxA family transcriptional regulator n=1 Tax=Novosphingobium sp. ZN18A2 TaxID=3079861 RepID=UPI0030D3617B